MIKFFYFELPILMAWHIFYFSSLLMLFLSALLLTNLFVVIPLFFLYFVSKLGPFSAVSYLRFDFSTWYPIFTLSPPLSFSFSLQPVLGVSKNSVKGPDDECSETLNIWMGPGFTVPHMLLTIGTVLYLYCTYLLLLSALRFCAVCL